VVYQNLGKNSKTSFSEMVFSRAKCRLSGKQKNFFRKTFSNENCTFFMYFVERNPLRSISVIFVERIFFGHIVVFCQCGLETQNVLENLVTLEGWVILPQFLPDCKVLWMTLEQLFEIFIKRPIFDSSRAICALLRGQNQLLVPSGGRKARKTSKISG
jgi:hypothetical protein